MNDEALYIKTQDHNEVIIYYKFRKLSIRDILKNSSKILNQSRKICPKKILKCPYENCNKEFKANFHLQAHIRTHVK